MPEWPKKEQDKEITKGDLDIRFNDFEKKLSDMNFKMDNVETVLIALRKTGITIATICLSVTIIMTISLIAVIALIYEVVKG